jgi:hypothetical protein
VRLVRDWAGHRDSTKQTSSCPSSGTNLECHFTSKKGTQRGHWYYFRLDLTHNPTSYPSSVYQGQTRRYKVIDATHWQFIAHQYGG